jgi:hypothetical protein
MKTLKSPWLRRQSRTLVTGGAVRSGRRRGAFVVLIASWVLISQVAQPALADGSSWTAVAAAEANPWQSVAYGDGVFVAVAQDGTNRVMRSVDGGLTWSAVAATEAKLWRSVAYGDGVFVAVAPSQLLAGVVEDLVMRSVDGGVTWSKVSVPRSPWTSVAYGAGVWVAVARSGTNRVMRSVDGGLTWSAVAATEANEWWSVAYGDGVWVAVARSGTNRVMRSTDDGENWTAVPAAEGNNWFSVAYGEGVFVAVAGSGTSRVMRSGTWTGVGVQDSGTSESRQPPALTCDPLPPAVGATITCTVTGGDPDIDVLWRAAYDPTFGTAFAEAGVTLDGSGTGTFSFVVPAAALGEELTVELVEWLAPLSLGTVGGLVPTSVPAGEGPTLPDWLAMVGLVALVGAAVAARRGKVVAG